ncbi:MAG: DUF692 domain-containing protein [Cellvibrionaceae bacterium]
MTRAQAVAGLAPATSRWFRQPVAAGVSLKPQHFAQAAACSTSGLWYEIHPENYMMAGGPRLAGLEQVAARHPISFHGVGASLGGAQLPDAAHIARLARLIQRVEPVMVSEHAVWSQHEGTYFADLLPLPRTKEAMANLIRGVDCMQTGIGRPILLENPSNYLAVHSEMDEADFLVEVAQRSGCGLLLDVNNLWLSACNVGIDPQAYIRALPPALVGEIHIAGHEADPQFGDRLLIDSHGAGVADAVWALLDTALAHLGPTPVLLERDINVPDFAELIGEAERANLALRNVSRRHG